MPSRFRNVEMSLSDKSEISKELFFFCKRKLLPIEAFWADLPLVAAFFIVLLVLAVWALVLFKLKFSVSLMAAELADVEPEVCLFCETSKFSQTYFSCYSCPWKMHSCFYFAVWSWHRQLSSENRFRQNRKSLESPPLLSHNDRMSSYSAAIFLIQKPKFLASCVNKIQFQLKACVDNLRQHLYRKFFDEPSSSLAK